jgi:hypothetical protein
MATQRLAVKLVGMQWGHLEESEHGLILQPGAASPTGPSAGEHRGGASMASLTMTCYSTTASVDRNRRAATKSTTSAK